MTSNLYIAENNSIVELVQPLRYGGTIKDKKIQLEYYLHDFLMGKEDFMVFMRLLQILFNDIKSVADDFENLADVNNVVNIFLPKLSYLMNYTFRYDLPDSINRDLIKRLLWIYKEKGTDKEVLEAADFANNDNWISNTIFVPTEKNPIPVPDDRTAFLYYPIDRLFTWDKSAYSISDRYGDSTRWRDGVVVIEAEDVNKRVRNAIKKVLPAGLKVYYESKSELKADGKNGEEVGYGKSLKYKEWILNPRYTLDYFLRIDNSVSSDRWSEDNINYRIIWSGRQILFPYYELDKIIASSMLTLYKEDVLDIFYFLKVLEASIPVGLSYSTDEDTQKSVDIINTTRDTEGTTYELKTREIAPTMMFNQTRFNQTSFNTPAIETYLETEGVKPKIGTTQDISLTRFNMTAYSGRFILNQKVEDEGIELDEFSIKDNEDNSIEEDKEIIDGITTSELQLKSEVLKNPTLTELLTFYRNLLFSQYKKYFSLWTDKPIHDISTYQIQPVTITKSYRGFPRYDRNYGYSGKYSLSGLNNTVYMQAKYEHIQAWDNHYPVSDILSRVPPLIDYPTGGFDSLGKLDERMRIDVQIFKRMEYRGFIEAEFYNSESALFLDSLLEDEVTLLEGINFDNIRSYMEVRLSDLVASDKSIGDTFLRKNREETLFDVFLSDYCIIEDSELVMFSELKFNYVFQHKDFITRTKIKELILSVPYGHLRYVLYNGIDKYKYLEQHEDQNKIDVDFETDYGIRPISKSLLSERLVDTEEKNTGIDYKRISFRKLNDKYLNEIKVNEIELSSEVYSFNLIHDIEGKELKLSTVVYPSKNHNTIRLEEEFLTSSYGRHFIRLITLDNLVRVLES